MKTGRIKLKILLRKIWKAENVSLVTNELEAKTEGTCNLHSDSNQALFWPVLIDLDVYLNGPRDSIDT